MQRKPGGYRKPTEEQRQLSMIDKKSYDQWFQQFWRLSGASTREHPAPFPLELAYRLVRMFSFVGDTVLDPFCGTGTTMVAAMRADRDSIGVDVDPVYCEMAYRRLLQESNTLFGSAHVEMLDAAKAEELTKAAPADGARDNCMPSARLYHQPPQTRRPALIRENAASSSDESVPGSD